MKHFYQEISIADSGLRLDIFSSKLTGLSRRYIRKVISTGGVYINNKRVKQMSRYVRTADKVDIYLKETPLTDTINDKSQQAKGVFIPIIYEDKNVIVVNKPKGIPSQSTLDSDKACLPHYISKQLCIKESDIKIVHRLDTNVSGAIIFAKNRKSAANLSSQLQSKLLSRYYIAVVKGSFPELSTIKHLLYPQKSRHKATKVFAFDIDTDIDKVLPKSLQSIKPMFAETYVEDVFRSSDFSLILLSLKTGRTHQIRSQLTAIGYPVFGDVFYGGSYNYDKNNQNNIALHSVAINFLDPKDSNQKRYFSAKMPEEIIHLLQEVGFDAIELENSINSKLQEKNCS